MTTTIISVSITILSLIAFLLWWYRQGKKSAAAELVKEELVKTGKIYEEAKRIDEETSKTLAESCGDDGSDPRAFWLSGRDD